MKHKMTQDEIMYAMDKLVLCYKGERGSFIRSQGWSVLEFEREMFKRLMAGEFQKDTYKPKTPGDLEIVEQGAPPPKGKKQ
jgi:hypothetical protein